ncbi:MAG: acetate kinase [Deferribacteraceae bacterium]|jgi:acetate kinase|nr:acetate kinase [Deferribacteraceae bacterium]
MKVLALNCGSSSLKYQLFEWDNQSVISKGAMDRIGEKASVFSHDGKKDDCSLPNHVQAIELLLQTLQKEGVVASVTDINVVAHRVVHGGQQFAKSVLITDEVVSAIRELSFLAPLHNPANLDGIEAARKGMPNVPQVAVFDTAFHQTMPDYAYRYALPAEWYDKFRVRRYGFHGTSHLYVSKRAAKMLGKPASACNIITLHVGNGVSVAAIRNGVSVDTSMGMTPLEGAIMGTRCGDIDASIPIFMQDLTKRSAKEVYDDMNKRSGMLGITAGRYTDRRDIEKFAADGDEQCKLAMEMECYKLKQYIGKYMATLGTVDAIVFTAGVGENSPTIRGITTSGLEALGIKLDKAINEKTYGYKDCGDVQISAADSKIKVFVIPTNEEIVLVEDAIGVLKGTYADHMNYQYSFL